MDDSSLADSVQREGNSLTTMIRQQLKRCSRNPLLVTVLSALAFLVTGTWVWSLKFVLVLFPVLVLHETGHLLAMRILGYRNIRFFFVPLLGAAVAGRSETGSITHRITVCLAGPIPGILIGLLMWHIGISTQNELLRAFTIMLLVVNGINLLPILPLDGGWLFQTLLLSKRPWCDFSFRCSGALILLGGSIATRSWLLVALVVLFIPGLKSAFHFCRIYARLLQTLKPADPVRPEVFENRIILQEVQNEFPGAVLTEAAAEEWIQRIQKTHLASTPSPKVIVSLISSLIGLLLASGGVLFDLLQT